MPISCYFFQYDAAGGVSRYVLGTGPSQLGFLLVLFDVFLIFWPLSGFFEKHDFAGLIVALGFYACGLLANFLNIPNLFGVWNGCKHLIMFWLGFKLSQNGAVRQIVNKIPVYVLIAAYVVLFVAMQYVDISNLTIMQLAGRGTEWALHFVGALAAFTILRKIALRVNWQNGLTSFRGGHYPAIYCTNKLFISVYFGSTGQ